MSNDKSEGKAILIMVIVVIAVITAITFIIAGPKGCSRTVQSWSASAYGSDWLIVQYAYDGTVIASWELKSKSVENESSSDGIVFIDNYGSVVHLSGGGKNI